MYTVQSSRGNSKLKGDKNSLQDMYILFKIPNLNASKSNQNFELCNKI